jgi:predicted  nucleic acid-binding Zn-ribbon protein
MPPARKTDALIPLQDLDLQIHRLKVQRAEKPRQLASFEEKLAHAKDNVTAIQAEIKALKLEGQKREHSVKEFDEKISKIQGQAMLARKNEEYQAFQKEISGYKADKSRIEDGLLDIYMQVDDKGKLEKLRQEELKQSEGEHAAARKRIEGEMAELDREIEALLSKRSALTAGAEKEILRLYDRILDAKDDGIALAAAEKYETIEDVGKVTYWQCAGCSVGLNAQDVNILLLGKDIHFCRNCSRILYIKPA